MFDFIGDLIGGAADLVTDVFGGGGSAVANIADGGGGGGGLFSRIFNGFGDVIGTGFDILGLGSGGDGGIFSLLQDRGGGLSPGGGYLLGGVISGVGQALMQPTPKEQARAAGMQASAVQAARTKAIRQNYGLPAEPTQRRDPNRFYGHALPHTPRGLNAYARR